MCAFGKETMGARFVLCLTIVAAFQGRPGAQSAIPPEISEEVPVPGGTADVAAALGIDPVPDRARFIGELTRLAYDIPQGKNSTTDSRLRRLRTLLASMHSPAGHEQAPGDLVPVPLTAAIWGQAVFQRSLTASGLFAAILGDRRAALLCHGLAGLDDETLRFFAERPELIARLYQRAAPAFAAFGAHLQVRSGRVVPPGGAAAVPVWEAALGEHVDQPDRFVLELFGRSDGRVAYLYGTISQIDRPKAAFALGLWMVDPQFRIERFKALVGSVNAAYREWRVQALPFTRPPYDAATMLARVQTDEVGRPALASRELWGRVFETVPPAAPAGQPDVADAAWLVDAIAGRDSLVRADRMDQFGFGQRVFAAAAAETLPDVSAALSAFPRCRMLMLTLERMGVSNPSIYASAARRAGSLSSLDANRGVAALAQFQGTLALLARMVRVHTFDAVKAEPLVASLVAVPLTGDGRYAGRLANWIQETLRPALAPADNVEEALLDALAGPRALESGSLTIVSWEGQQYRLDLTNTELRRLRRVREKQGGATVDLAVELDAAARTLVKPALTLADIHVAMDEIAQVAPKLAAMRTSDLTMNGAEAWTRQSDVLGQLVKRLSKINREKDAGTAARAAGPCEDIADRVLAEALLSLAYAMDLGDPDGTVLLAGNVARRHDFGFALKDANARARISWGLPKSNVAPGTPWHVSGSLLGLDIGLAPLALRRINTDHVVAAPTLTSNERDTFTASLALMNPFALTDRDRDTIGEAVRRGRVRVTALTTDTFGPVVAEIGMDGWRRRALQWTLGRPHGDPDRATAILSLFSMTELLRLGTDAPVAALDAWGMAALAPVGCICTRLVPPGPWTLWTGRPQLGLMATTLADLNLKVAETLYELRLPAALARHVLAAAVQDFIDEAKPTDPDDWLTLARAAQHVSRERVEDYVAAAAADGPLLPEASPDRSHSGVTSSGRVP
jgi:hypothetical protein